VASIGKRWPEIRAGLLAVVVLFGLVEGCPLPPPEFTPEWEQPFVEPLRRAQRVVLTPVAWIDSALRVSQRWALYQAPSRERFRLWIEGRDDRGRWQLLFRAGDPEHPWDGERIDYTRPRGTWDPTTAPPAQYGLFARWVAQRILDEHPTWVAARVRLEKVRITDDGQEPSGDFVHTLMRLRDAPP
jgi:hypothetical protein